jgi:RimJ/RimL family protein N-acetyltransferase
MEELAGLVQVRQLEADFGTAEWGFALGDAFWGTGLFMESAPLVVDFAFRDARFHRLEARASVDNRRGNRVLEKLGAVFEGTLRDSFSNSLLRTDQMLWAIVADEWLAAHPVPSWESSAPFEKPPETEPSRRPPPLAPWRAGLPDLRGDGVTVRELRPEDAESLAVLFADPDVGRYIPPPPPTARDFARFISWAHEQRKSGSVICLPSSRGARCRRRGCGCELSRRSERRVGLRAWSS